MSASQHSTTSHVDAEHRPKMRFTLKTALVLVAIVAAAFTVLVQQRRLSETTAALSRYEDAQIPTSLPPDQVRVIARSILDTDHVKFVTFRIETAEEHFAIIESGGDSNGCISDYDPKTGLHCTAAIILIDHIESANKVKMMPKVGGAQGYTVMNVPDDYSLNDAVTFKKLERLYSRDETVELFEWKGRTYVLRLK